MAKQIDPCTLVLFGASGNLSRIKLMPGLFRLDAAGRLADDMKILSVGRGELSREAWQAEVKGMLDALFLISSLTSACVAIPELISNRHLFKVSAST